MIGVVSCSVAVAAVNKKTIKTDVVVAVMQSTVGSFAQEERPITSPKLVKRVHLPHKIAVGLHEGTILFDMIFHQG